MRDLIEPGALAPSLAPFGDANFKLAVLAELMATRALDLGSPAAFRRAVDPQAGTGAQAPSQIAYDYLGRYPLKDWQLAGVRFLEFDPDLAIYDYVHPHWGGRDGLFDIHDLRDLRLLPGLERLNTGQMLRDTDLRALRSARRLERITLGPAPQGSPWRHLDALLALPRLSHLTLFKRDLERWFRNPVLRVLRDQGVTLNLLG